MDISCWRDDWRELQLHAELLELNANAGCSRRGLDNRKRELAARQETGFLAIHSTRRGPALGGVRIMRYPSEALAFEDALRLSRAMTLKTALADLPAGGGKAVILDRPGLRRRAAFEAFGRVVEGMQGRFHTGPDVGVRPADLEAIARSTSHVAREGDRKLGDISQHTALGVSHAMRACFELAGIAPRGARVVIQGAGNVGGWLARILAEVGCIIAVADVNGARARRVAREVGGVALPPARALTTACDALAPCALGGVLDARSIPRLRARIFGWRSILGLAPQALCFRPLRGLLKHNFVDLLNFTSVLYFPNTLPL